MASDFKPCSVPGCNGKMRSVGYCIAHYKRHLKYGNPLGGRTYRFAVPAWLDAHKNYDGDDCLVWPFARLKSGYGVCDKKLGSSVASRVMCTMAHGEPPTPEHEASHSCGNGNLGCMNPKHLRWMTHQENMSEKAAHGTNPQGEKHPMARLTEQQVHRIRFLANTMSATTIGRIFGVTQGMVSLIVKRERWGWLE